MAKPELAEAQLRATTEDLTAEILRLQVERSRLLSAAADLIAKPERHDWGRNREGRGVYYLDGELAGTTIEDLILKAAEKARGEDA